VAQLIHMSSTCQADGRFCFPYRRMRLRQKTHSLKRGLILRNSSRQVVRVSSEENWRVFCAIHLPEKVREGVMRYIASLRELFPQVHAAWSRDANIHLTLKFLGEVPQSSIHKLSDAASRAVASLERFTIATDQAGVFPKHGSPRVLWIGINDVTGRLVELQTRLEDECVKEGFAREARPFHPHLTLARLRKPQHAGRLASAHKQLGFGCAEITVSELLVIRSELSNKGSQYTVTSRHPLRPSAARDVPAG
jgi:2'-5' RNA ligase